MHNGTPTQRTGITVRLSPALQEAVQRASEDSGLSVSAIVRLAISDLLLAPWRPKDQPWHPTCVDDDST